MTKTEKDMEEKAAEEILKEEAQEGPEEEPDEDDAGEGSAEGADEPEAAEDEVADVKYLRLAADFQNYKKRTERERYERYTDGKKDFAEAMLPILDNFDRALAQDAADAESERERLFIEGMELILKQFNDALAKNGVVEIEALGTEFDPNMHHAVIMEPSDDYESQTVSDVLQKGYRIGDKVIRPSMVKVAE